MPGHSHTLPDDVTGEQAGVMSRSPCTAESFLGIPLTRPVAFLRPPDEMRSGHAGTILGHGRHIVSEYAHDPTRSGTWPGIPSRSTEGPVLRRLHPAYQQHGDGRDAAESPAVGRRSPVYEAGWDDHCRHPVPGFERGG